jgi:nucleoside-diphosphate-sugar epimerase
MVVPRFIQAALNNEDIVIYDDGSQSRVFCHVEDAVKAVLTLVDTDSTIGDYFNVGGTGETTIKELAEKVRATGQSADLPPMNSYYRRLIHNVFVNDPEVASTSAGGDARFKRIILQRRQK